MKFRLILPFLTTLLFAASFQTARAQSLPQEYTSIFTDRDVCMSGEIVNFSVWHVQSSSTDLPLSSTMYVELLDGKGQPILKQKYRIRDGSCRGAMEIPSIVPTGVYFLRAYTQYQRNFPPESHATTVLTIINSDRGIKPAPIISDSALSMRFEGGAPLAGLSTRVVIKAPVSISSADSLYVVGESGSASWKVLETVGPYCLMELEGNPDARYEITYEKGGNSWKHPVKRTLSLGLTLDLDRPSSTDLWGTMYPASSLMASPNLTLVLTDRNFHPLHQIDYHLLEDGLEFRLADLEPAIRYLFIKTQEGNVLVGSMLPEEDDAGLQVELSDEVLGPRQSSTLQITSTATPGVSVSVTKSIPLPAEFYLDLIWANPWLIEHLTLPDSLLAFAHVLQGDFLHRNAARLLGGHDQDWLPESRDLGISGRVTKANSQEAASDVLTVVSVVGEDPQIHACHTDSTGYFQVSLRNLQGTETIFIGAKEPPSQDYQLTVNQDFRKETPAIRPVALQYDSAFHQAIEALLFSQQVISRFKKVPMEEILPSRSVPTLPVNIGSPDVSLNVDDFIELQTMEEVIRNIVPKVSVRGAGGEQPYLTVFEDRTLQVHENPLILLDYAVVFDIEALLEISPRKLNRFDVYQGTHYLGDERFDGIISIFTHTDDFARYPFDRFGAFVSYSTLEPALSIGVADYVPEEWPSNFPDYRSVLYWHPDAETSTRIQSGDQPGIYRVRLSGMTPEGKIIRKEKLLEVSKSGH